MSTNLYGSFLRLELKTRGKNRTDPPKDPVRTMRGAIHFTSVQDDQGV